MDAEQGAGRQEGCKERGRSSKIRPVPFARLPPEEISPGDSPKLNLQSTEGYSLGSSQELHWGLTGADPAEPELHGLPGMERGCLHAALCGTRVTDLGAEQGCCKAGENCTGSRGGIRTGAKSRFRAEHSSHSSGKRVKLKLLSHPWSVEVRQICPWSAPGHCCSQTQRVSPALLLLPQSSFSSTGIGMVPGGSSGCLQGTSKT